ncbi:MAG: D-alanyl-D-alanine carboxypeptidase/D-alanyl-D-alanine-endopeptidase [Cyanobacteriota bacterium]|nr:D-alanyl-D-alanine carboxypeptidase/D-alanyl-D-alanine-endopeptidase [Cyanobacteriota bacterium]
MPSSSLDRTAPPHPWAPGLNRRALAAGLSLALLSPIVAGGAALASSPALPGLQDGRRPVPVLPLPPLTPALGVPSLGGEPSCPALQQRLAAQLAGEREVWSVSIADASGRLLADVNGTRSRVPASNQKLVSTAFALDRLGPDFRLNTQLWRLADGTLRLTGQGDPDLALPQLQRFTKLALRSGGSTGQAGGVVRLQVAEVPQQSWWPQGWHYADRAQWYGAPITRLALTSNAIDDAVSNPVSRLQALMRRTANQQGGDIQMQVVSADQPLPADAVLVHEEPSTSMQGLLSLANSDSHNFTAEVLLRSGASSWDLTEAVRRQTVWLSQQGLPMEGVRVADGSGLDRANRLTSRFLTALLMRMDQHPYGRAYVSSMAIAGRRGTLKNLYVGTPLAGRVYAKTGTLTGVRSISGLLLTETGPRYFSAISNGASAPNATIGRVLRDAQNVALCP